MNIAKVISISDIKKVTTKYGDKEKCFVCLAEASTGKEYDCGYFIPKQGLSFAVGDEVFCEMFEQNGYFNVKNISLPEKPVVKPKLEEVKTEPVVNYKEEERKMWDGKERRDYRGRGLAYALNFVDVLLKHGFYTEQDKSDLSRDLMWMEVLKYSRWANDNIFDDGVEMEKEDHCNPFEKK